MTGGSASSYDQVTSNVGAGYNKVTLSSTTDPERVIPIGTETSSVALIANPNNSNPIYIGFDDNVDSTTGFPLEAGTPISMDVDANQQGIFAIPQTGGDEINWIALE